MSDNGTERQGCYGECTEARTSCFTWRDVALEIAEDEQKLREQAAYTASVIAKDDKRHAVKLDSGKRKLSLIHPSTLFLLLPRVKTEQDSHMNAAMRALSLAAHAVDATEFSDALEASLEAIAAYLPGGNFEAIEQLAIAMEYGEAKPEYGRNNWKQGMKWSRLLDAAMRHGLAILKGELVDPDSGNRHVAHMLASIHMLIGNMDLGVGKNDIFLED